MSHISVSVLRLRLQAVILSMLVVVLGFASEAAAVIYDLNVANGNYNVAANWIDHADDRRACRRSVDVALVRNGGTLNITAADGNATAYVIRIGAGPQTVLILCFPMWIRQPLLRTAARARSTGRAETFSAHSSVGPRLSVGQRDNANNTNYTGIVNHSGGKISLNTDYQLLGRRRQWHHAHAHQRLQPDARRHDRRHVRLWQYEQRHQCPQWHVQHDGREYRLR